MPTDGAPSQPVFCVVGHRLRTETIAMDMAGTIICLECVALVHDSGQRIAGRLIAVMLNLAPMPSRKEIGA